MTGLLVSVRSADEARHAVNGGADLIDVKEPRHGALGRAAPAVWQAVARVVAGRVPTSVALGELRQITTWPATSALAGHRYAKVGLMGCRRWAAWPRRWFEFLTVLPRSITPVAVVYADWVAAGAPAPADVLAHAFQAGCGVVLLDTYDKRGGDLFAHWTLADLIAWADEVRRHGLPLVLAGSLGPVSIPRALQAEPDYIAVRGAACDGPRTGAVAEHLVRDLASLVQVSATHNGNFRASVRPLT
jgi:uncharacterized protein (UPF0264 family)